MWIGLAELRSPEAVLIGECLAHKNTGLPDEQSGPSLWHFNLACFVAI